MSTGFDELPLDDVAAGTAIFEDVQMEQQEPDLPFYLIRPPPVEETLNGSTNLILHNDRQHAFKQYCCKKVKEPLSAFLPDFPGNINTTSFFVSGDEAKETSTLSSLLDPKFQIVKKDIHPLNNSSFSAFRLYPGPLPEEYMIMVQTTAPVSNGGSKKSKKSKRSSDGEMASSEKKKKKKEKKKKKDKKSTGND